MSSKNAISQYVGSTFKISYENGLVFKVTYPTETMLMWEGIEGENKGKTGTETIHSLEVSPSVYFLNWIEKDGLTISQVLDLNNMTVNTFMTFDENETRQGAFQSATVTVIENL